MQSMCCLRKHEFQVKKLIGYQVWKQLAVMVSDFPVWRKELYGDMFPFKH